MVNSGMTTINAAANLVTHKGKKERKVLTTLLQEYGLTAKRISLNICEVEPYSC